MIHGKRKFKYKGVSVNILGLPSFSTSKNETSGKKKFIKKRHYLRSFTSNFNKKDAPKNLLLMYDIPHVMKKERDWFRRQLKNFDFIMIQKSVWVGPSPLPPDFLNYLKKISLKKEFKTFKLAKPYTEKTNSI